MKKSFKHCRQISENFQQDWKCFQSYANFKKRATIYVGLLMREDKIIIPLTNVMSFTLVIIRKNSLEKILKNGHQISENLSWDNPIYPQIQPAQIYA